MNQSQNRKKIVHMQQLQPYKLTYTCIFTKFIKMNILQKNKKAND